MYPNTLFDEITQFDYYFDYNISELLSYNSSCFVLCFFFEYVKLNRSRHLPIENYVLIIAFANLICLFCDWH